MIQGLDERRELSNSYIPPNRYGAPNIYGPPNIDMALQI
jgi:hypothetical protein